MRLSAGKMMQINFGTAIMRVVRLDVNDAAFLPGAVELQSEWRVRLPQLVELLEPEESRLRLVYIDAGADRKLTRQRLRTMRRAIMDLWRAVREHYRLEFQTRAETSLPPRDTQNPAPPILKPD